MEKADIAIDEPTAAAKLGKELFRHAEMAAFNDVFWLEALMFISLLPLVFFMNNTQRSRGGSTKKKVSQKESSSHQG